MKVVEQFKRRILDLAIRGKLVPQDPNDEPASVLLERIKAEKDKLVKAGKIKKEKNSSRIVIGSDGAAYEKFGCGDLSHAEARRAQSGRAALVAAVDVPVELPQGWAWTRLEEISCTICGKKNQILAKEIKQTGKWAVVSQGQNLVDGYSDLDEKVVRDVPIILFGDHTRNVKYLDFPFVVGADGTKLLQSFVNAKWLYYWVLYASSKIMDRGYARHWNELIHLPVSLPPIDEQKRIVAKIEELFAVADSLGSAADGLKNAAKRLDKKILDLAIRGRLVPQDPNDEPASELVKRIAASHKSPSKNQSEPIDPPFDIPDSWEWVRLGTITNYGQCKSIDAKAISPDTWSLDLEEIEKDTGRLLARRTAAEKKSTSSKHIFCRGMVLYSKLRTYLNKVLVADMDGVCTSEIVPISVVDGVCPEYLCLVLTSQYFLQYTASRGYGVKMPRVGTNDMRSALIPLPPLDEQKRIVKRVDALKATARSLVTF